VLFDLGAAVPEKLIFPLLDASDKMRDERSKEFERIAEGGEIPNKASPAVERQMEALSEDVQKTLEGPGTGLKGPPPMPPTSGTELLKDILGELMKQEWKPRSENRREMPRQAFGDPSQVVIPPPESDISQPGDPLTGYDRLRPTTHAGHTGVSGYGGPSWGERQNQYEEELKAYERFLKDNPQATGSVTPPRPPR